MSEQDKQDRMNSLMDLSEIAGEGSVLLLVAARLVDKEAGMPVGLKPATT
jgi:hypothetical protein